MAHSWVQTPNPVHTYALVSNPTPTTLTMNGDMSAAADAVHRSNRMARAPR